MVCIRKATIDDLLAMQACNLFCLPENYQMKFYFYHIVVATAALGCRRLQRPYCRLRIGQDGRRKQRVPRPYPLPRRTSHAKLGLATKLMSAAQSAMEQVFGAEYISLHDVEANYYADGEDAFDTRKQLKGKQNHHHEHHHHHHHELGDGCCSGEVKSSETKSFETRGEAKSVSKASTKSDSKVG